MQLNSRKIVDLSEVYGLDEDLIGKKAYEIGLLWKLGIPLSSGFVVTTEFFKEFLRQTRIDNEIEKIQAINHPALSDSVEKLFYPIKKQIMQKHMPQELTTQLHKFYRELSGTFNEKPLDIYSSSFDNKSISFSDIKGDANLILKIKTIWSSSFTKPVAVVIQEYISSGVNGRIITDNPTIDKKLTKDQANKLIDYCKIIRKHFYFPYEIEYAIRRDKLFVVKISPFTDNVSKTAQHIVSNKIHRQKILTKGISINPGIVTGPVKVLRNTYKNAVVKKGEIAVMPKLDASLFGKIKNAKAVIVNSISTTSLDKALCRKSIHVPTVICAKNATEVFRNGNVVTVNGMTGEIYSGGLIY
jgi:phosphoenolpyruvate synthase/pyruvate phosphate dikinase